MGRYKSKRKIFIPDIPNKYLSLMELEYENAPLRPSRSAYYELRDLNMDLEDACEVLENGYAPAGVKRGKGTIEKCLDTKKGTVKVVVKESFEQWSKQDVWAIVHVGRFKKSRQK